MDPRGIWPINDLTSPKDEKYSDVVRFNAKLSLLYYVTSDSIFGGTNIPRDDPIIEVNNNNKLRNK